MSTTLEKTNRLKLFLLLIPFAITLGGGSYLCNFDNALKITIWQLVFFVFGLLVLPLTFKIYSMFKDAGYIMSKPIGILLVSIIVWTLAHLKLPLFSVWGILAVMVLVVFLCYFNKNLRNNFTNKLFQTGTIEHIVFEESLFSVFLIIFCFFRGIYPAINGEEKFMDYGFVMSLMRTSVLPANDIWLSGFKINYYYFGQFIYTTIMKVTFIKPAFAYNIALATSFALPFMMAFTIGCELTEAAEIFSEYKSKFRRFFGGLFTGLAVIFFGNSHSFFYDNNSFGFRILKLFSSWGINVGNLDKKFFYPDSTRYIGYNPIMENDCTIHEFPFYSFLVGDLHAHVISMMVVLLIISLSIILITKTKFCDVSAQLGSKLNNSRFNFNFSTSSLVKTIKNSVSPLLIFIGVLLGIAQMCNYWDFLIYFIFIAMALLIAYTKSSERFSTIAGFIGFLLSLGVILTGYLMFANNPLIHLVAQIVALLIIFFITHITDCALTRSTFSLSILFTIAHITALPFNLNFNMISNTIGLTKTHSPIFQLFILWGTHIIISLIFIIFVVIYKNYKLDTSVKVLKYNYQTNDSKGATEETKSKNPLLASENVISQSPRFTNKIQKFIGERNLMDVFVCGIIVTGIMMVIAPEIMYVTDIYQNGYLRANTMFKFTFAAFIMLGIALTYGVIRMFYMVNKKQQLSKITYPIAIISLILLIVIPGHYTFLSLQGRFGTYNRFSYKSLDGIDYLKTWDNTYGMSEEKLSKDKELNISHEEGKLSEYLEAINYLNNNVSGSHVICEAPAESSYSDYNIVSAYTGLPTLIGWPTHERLWRFQGVMDQSDEQSITQKYIFPRTLDSDKLYLSDNMEETKEIIEKYNIEYIVYGQLERDRCVRFHGVDKDAKKKLSSLGELVFSYDDPANEASEIYIYKVN